MFILGCSTPAQVAQPAPQAEPPAQSAVAPAALLSADEIAALRAKAQLVTCDMADAEVTACYAALGDPPAGDWAPPAELRSPYDGKDASCEQASDCSQRLGEPPRDATWRCVSGVCSATRANLGPATPAKE
jgi:hypothetical protein